jgi:hypothetical protein
MLIPDLGGQKPRSYKLVAKAQLGKNQNAPVVEVPGWTSLEHSSEGTSLMGFPW